jgi:hypothetical protein
MDKFVFVRVSAKEGSGIGSEAEFATTIPISAGSDY